MNPSPEIALNEWTWKTEAAKSMAVAVCRLALARGINGEFSALDLEEHGAGAHGGTGICGTIFGQLAKAEIIAPVGLYSADGKFFQKRVRNAGGNPVGVWRLRHPGLAGALVDRHTQAPRPKVQEEFEFAGKG